MEKWAEQSAVALVNAIQEKKISACELMEYFIERTERLNPEINAIVAKGYDQARKKAIDADKALARGESMGPLHGLPMTLKDNLQIIGMPATYGSELLAEFMPTENSDVTESLLDAGAIVFGKTNLPLFAMDAQTFNDVYGQSNNPWDTSRTPGGSSGGAAAALAAGLTGLEIGNDIGGSIRLPAHFCGVYGHKPSYNIVSMHGAKFPLIPIDTKFPADIDLAVNGPLARSAEDLKLAMDVVVGAPSYQRKAIKISLPESRKQILSEFKVGVWIDDPLFPPDSDSGAVLSDFIDRLAETGVTLVNKKPNIDLRTSHELRAALAISALSLSGPHEEYLKALEDRNSDDEYAQFWGKSMTMEHRDWLFLDYIRSFERQQWDDYFNDVDVMLCPVASIPAHPHDHTPIETRTVQFNGETANYLDVVIPWNALSLVSYLPATVVPAGFTPGNLPVGIQIIGPYLEDLTAIQFAINLEKEIIGPFQLPSAFDS
ncbi:MAG: amidase [Deltaproteobacteria bacterium]|jgi:amidase|nr:amidase [Deltaproteobacteria bacterium]MBT4089212.1 amidase [Deltaproteobacteria bacterium]MBT4267985.1 amidase [Deltaproteobacteria bacterium]MBT4642201.1 amidase [Deltaproteobacteria bacterium]MBT7890812.1 amidase [Deltaproteobacteria bacterium]